MTPDPAPTRPTLDYGGEILQPATGPTEGCYIQATPETVQWGRLPNRSTPPIAQVPSGSVVTIDTISHEGLLEDQGRNPLAYFGAFGVPPQNVLRDAVAVAACKPHDGPGPHVVTGPLHVTGAVPGDVLKIEVLRLRRRVPYGVISNRHRLGALPGELPEEFAHDPACHPYFNSGGNISVFAPVRRMNGKERGVLPGPGGASFPLDPFLGIMGVGIDTTAVVNSIPPTVAGGNMDIRDLGVGATLYLPVQLPGAKFYAGDPHFAQGDGEVALTAHEASLRATLRVSVVKPGGDAPAVAFRYPFAETPEYWLPIGLSDPDGPVGGEYTSLDLAMRTAVRNALTFLHEELGLDGPVAYAYLSAAANFAVSQVVDITTGIHARIRKADFADR
ncbi:acetamidase/formamidase family protein [Dactylosporangium sp. CA-139114]|uniref:acetamidase/formamidase family protein n=1 Tax=Dactylosporangium sp. CA-139114 TaxID=3239931 RepID=UPI003D972F1A